jgi:hypothetical protein
MVMNVIAPLAQSSIMKMDAASSFETSVNYRIARRHIPEISTFHDDGCESLTYFSIMKMDATSSSETSVNYQIA